MRIFEFSQWCWFDWANDNPTAQLGLSVLKFPNFCCRARIQHRRTAAPQFFKPSAKVATFLPASLEWSNAISPPSQSVHDASIKQFDAEHEQLIWSHPGTSNYHRNHHGRLFTVMLWRFVEYWWMTHDPDRTEYESGG